MIETRIVVMEAEKMDGMGEILKTKWARLPDDLDVEDRKRGE